MIKDKKFDALMIMIGLMAVVVIVLIVAVKIKQSKEEDTIVTSDVKVEEQTETDTEEETEPLEEEVVEEAEPVVTMVETTALVNVRATPDVSGEKLATVEAGSQFELVEQLDSGWTHILFNDADAYINSNYVVVVEDTSESADTTESSQE